MSYGLTLVTAPVDEPVSAVELKTHMRVEQEIDDDLIKSLGIAARRYCERILGQQFCTATWLQSFDRFPRYSSSAVWQQYSDGLWDQRIPQTELSGRWWPDKAALRLERPPLQSVTSVQYVDGTGTLVTQDPATYLTDTQRMPGRISPSFGNIWPIVRQQLNCVQVTFVAGYGAPAAVPEEAKLAIKILAYHWYEYRSPVEAPLPQSLEMHLAALLDSLWHGDYR